MTFLSELTHFVHQQERARDRAFDLWTWLPSSKKAQKCLGDYYSEMMPDMAEIMEEATLFIASKCNPEPYELEENTIYQCPCDGNCPKQKDDC